MERNPWSCTPRQHSLKVEVARLSRRPLVAPVTLERRDVRMPQGHGSAKDIRGPDLAQPQCTTTTSQSGSVSGSSSSSGKSSALTSSTTSSGGASSDMVASAANMGLTSASAATVVATTELAVAAAAPSPQISPSVSAVGAPIFTTAAPPSPTLLEATLATSVRTMATTTESASPIVGGKHPTAEESPVIILTQHIDEELDKDEESTNQRTDLPESTKTQGKARQELAMLETQKPDDSTKQVSNQQPLGDRGRDTERRAGKTGVQFSPESPVRRDAGHVMEFFQEQEKNLQASFLNLPKRAPRKQRSPSPNTQQTMGLEHLDNLIKLMEQLTSLKDENSRLRRRCDYLESTKVLLQAKRDLTSECSSSSPRVKTIATHKHKHQLRLHSHPSPRHAERKQVSDLARLTPTSGRGRTSPRVQRPRLSSADELEFLEILDSSSDQHPKRAKSALQKRSFSTGSLEVPTDILDEINGIEKRKRSKSKSGRGIFSGKPSKQKSGKGSKWSRVKKVLTGQKLYEDLGTTIRLLRDLGKPSHNIQYSTTAIPTRQVRPGATSFRPSGEPRPPEGAGIAPDPVSDSVFSVGSPLEPSPALIRSLSLSGPATESADSDLSESIWMGPPDWWEEYEAQKESGASTGSDISSVIEVTTMYLGGKKDGITASPTSSSMRDTVRASGGGAADTNGHSKQPEKFLKVGFTLPRRQSSPSLFAPDEGTDEELLEDLTITTDSSRLLHKSSSCKSADLELPKGDLTVSMSPKTSSERMSKKSHRTAWGRVKDIIHTRRDSIKKKPKREKTGVESEEPSEVDIEGMMEESWRTDSFAEGLLSRSTPKTSPIALRQSGSERPVGGASKSPQTRSSCPYGSSPGNVDMAALLAGSMSNEFNRKMQEWEEKRTKRSPPARGSMEDSELEVSVTSQDFPLKTMDLKEIGKVPDSTSVSESTLEESHTSLEVLGAPSINVEEIQKKMTESFSRKMQEWEKIKYKGSPIIAPRDVSPEVERKLSKVRKEDRPKSKRSREEKEKEKLERQRERDKQKVEREQIKLEKEKLRIEKERLRAMEREAKIERLKGRLSQAAAEGKEFKDPMLKPLAEYKITADFARKLHEWEVRKGLSHDVSTSIYLEARDKLTMETRRNSHHQLEKQSTDSTPVAEDCSEEDGSKPKSSRPPPLTLSPYFDSTDEPSPIEKEPGMMIEDDADTYTSVTEEFLTRSNIASLERANSQLVDQLQKKETEYADVQEEVIRVNEKLANVREQHTSEMARFHRELAQGEFTGPVKLEVGELENTMGELEDKIHVMETFGEKLAMSMESAAVGKWQSIEGEETVHTQLVDLVEQMRNMLVEATQSEEQSDKFSALSNFETLYSQAMKLQVQMNNLRLSHLERNREIMNIKRQLLLQEVNNLLLQADITRRETELYQFHEARKFASLRRWNTFGGSDRQRPKSQTEVTPAAPRAGRQADDTVGEAHQNIPCIAEDEAQVSTISSMSASAPPSAFETPHKTLPTSSPSHPDPTSSLSHSRSAEVQSSAVENLETSKAIPSSERFNPETTESEAKTQTGGVSATESCPSLLQLPPLTSSQKSRHSSTEVSSLSPSPTSPHSPSLTPSPLSSAQSSPLATTPTTPDISSQQMNAQLTMGSTSHDGALVVAVTAASLLPQALPPTTKPAALKFSDSLPLLREIEELKRVKGKVERGSPTLKRKDGGGPSPVPSPGRVPRSGSTPETPDPTIPKRQGLVKPRLTKAVPIIDDDDSAAQSVMTCTESSSQSARLAQLTHDQELRLVAESGSALIQLPPPADPTVICDLPPTSDPNKPGPKSPRSPVSKQKMLRRQREERETKLKEYRAISPKGSPVATRGKPPLPRQSTPIRQTPPASPAPEKSSPRSKSVGDVEHKAPDSPCIKPLQEAINKFEKRATVCDTEDAPIELRKTPSPTFHLPRVGVVSRVRRLKPAAELLEESQRYRSGQSIYATRILQRYITKDEKSRPAQTMSPLDKENVSSSTYVHAIVQRLSRETTPVMSGASSKSNSSLSLQRTDSPRAQSEFVTSIVRRLSSTSSTEIPKTADPFKDLTNGGQVKKLTKTFDDKTTAKSSPDRTLSETDIDRHQTPGTSDKSQHRKSCEVTMVISDASPTSDASIRLDSSFSLTSEDECARGQEAGSIPTNYQSLPTLTAPMSTSFTTPLEPVGRGRAATYSVTDPSTRPSSSDTGPHLLTGKRSKSNEKRPGQSSKDKRHPSSSLSPERPGKTKGDTVGILCKQSISFDLGVTLYSKKSPKEKDKQKSRKPRSWDPSESAKAHAAAEAIEVDSELSSSVFERPSTPGAASSPGPSSPASGRRRSKSERPVSGVSSASSGEMALESPTTEDKKKSRRFLDSSWLQKSKRFFKVSK